MDDGGGVPVIRPEESRWWGAFRRLPAALLGSLIALFCVEVALEIGIEDGDYPTRDHLRDTGAFRHVLYHHGAPEIAIVGASVARRSVVIPDLQAMIADATGRELRIVNYAHQGARADFVEDLVHVLLRQEPAPRVILYGLTPAQIASDNDPQKTSYVWGFADLPREFSEHPRRALAELPQVMGNEIKLRSRTLQVRYDPWGWRDYLWRGVDFPPGAMVGAQHHRGRFGVSSLADHADPAHGSLYEDLAKNAREATIGGRWTYSATRVDDIRSMAEACADRGVTLLLYEIPVPDIYRELFPANAYPDFYRQMEDLPVPFARLASTYTDAQFSDVVHMNLDGARQMSGSLSRQILIPTVRDLWGARVD